MIAGCVGALTLAFGCAGAGAAAASPHANRSMRQMRVIRSRVRPHERGIHHRGYLVPLRAHLTIVDGQPGDQDAWGFMAHVLYAPDHNPDWYCGGTLISANVVLTAAHCVTDEISGQPEAAEDFQVTTGAVDLSDQTHAQISDVSHVIVDPDYNPDGWRGDAALLILKKPSTAPTIRIAQSGETVPYSPGRDALIAGWGIPYAGGDASNVLQVAATNVRGTDYCEQYWDNFPGVWDTCAAQAPYFETATCNGDSGGPLLTQDANGLDVEIALTSVGPVDCATDRADYFTRTDVIADWVNRNVAFVSIASTSTSTTSTTTTSTTTSTSRTTTTTTTTTTTKPKVVKPPIVMAPPPLTMADARAHAATMVHARTHQRPRLKLSCKRRTASSVNCSIRWQAAGSSYAISGEFYNYLQGKRAYWWYAFTGTRRWAACRVHHHRRACVAYVQRFRWA
jgi:hypothetical protein